MVKRCIIQALLKTYLRILIKGGGEEIIQKLFSGPEIETLTKPGNPNVAWLEFSTLSYIILLNKHCNLISSIESFAKIILNP